MQTLKIKGWKRSNQMTQGNVGGASDYSFGWRGRGGRCVFLKTSRRLTYSPQGKEQGLVTRV